MAKIGSDWKWKAHKRIAVRANDPYGEVASLEPIYRETHYCLKDDRWLLKKTVAAYPDHFRDGQLQRFDTGWKRYCKIRENMLTTALQNLEAKGFEIEFA